MKKKIAVLLTLYCAIFAFGCGDKEKTTTKSISNPQVTATPTTADESTAANISVSFDAETIEYPYSGIVLDIPGDWNVKDTEQYIFIYPKLTNGEHAQNAYIALSPSSFSYDRYKLVAGLVKDDYSKDLSKDEGMYSITNMTEWDLSDNVEGFYCFAKVLVDSAAYNTFNGLVFYSNDSSVKFNCLYSPDDEGIYKAAFIDVISTVRPAPGYELTRDNKPQEDSAKPHKNDFLSTISKEDYYKSYHEGKYDTLYNLATEYISQNNPDEEDSAYIIKNTLDPIMQYWDNIIVSYDSFEDSARFYYNGVTEISDVIHFVPIASTSWNQISLSAGFYNTDWIFFDKLKFNTENKYFSLSAKSSKIEDIVDNGIYEEYTFGLDDKAIKELNTSENLIARFINSKKDSYFEFQFTDEEQQAFKVIQKFQGIRNIIDDLAFNYYKQD